METDRKVTASRPPPSVPPNSSVNAFPLARPMHGRTSGPTRRSTRGQWTNEEDEILRAAVQRFKGKNWKKIAECFKDRTDVQCLHRWQKVLNPDLIKGPWSKEEDEIIVQLVGKYGPTKWSTISQHLPGRIGKQCRERWHNHLNPGIKKEAWTQEEELVLIHAHDLYGNKWAELTKYLPGRTDNAIKNHWNSSVKKKLDSYKTSGLLEQFQGLPLVSHKKQSSGDGSFFGDGAQGEEISECSQIGCSQTPSDMSNTCGLAKEEDFIVSQESNQGKISSNSPTPSCSEQHYTSLDDMTFTISDIPYEFTCSSDYLDGNISNDLGSNTRDCNFEEVVITENCYLDSTNHDSVSGPSHKPSEYNVVALVDNFDTDPNVGGPMAKAEEGCSQILLTQEEGDAIIQRCSGIIDMEKYNDYVSFQSIYQLTETGGSTAEQPYNNLSATVLETPNNENMSFPLDISGQESLMMTNDEKLDQINDSLPQTDLLESSRLLVPVSTCASETYDDQQRTPPRIVRPTCEQEVGTLCYEPPRFPSLDFPFFSCDLAQSGTDVQQDFSPLGIRQFMMTSASSLTPFKLWDSPSSDDSPDALLKSAAKTFTGTPSILKKRHRDLLSPLSPFSERRYDKKTGNDINQGFLCASRLTKEFSRLDVILDDTVQCKDSETSSNYPKEHLNASVEEKENVCLVVSGLQEKANHNQEFEVRTPVKETHEDDLNNNEKERTPGVNSKTILFENFASEMPRGILVERQLNDTERLSPAGTRTSFRPSEVDGSRNPSKESAISGSPNGNAGFCISPPSFNHMKRNHGSEVSSSGKPFTTVMVDSLVNEVGAENLNFFGGTPFRRSMESPSAWKSPWYFSSVVSCPRFEPDITIEDIGIFMSPGDRGFDALGLMNQINGQGADTYADAREVLGSETPESILKQRCSKKLNLEGEKSNLSDNQLKGRLHSSPNIMTERRVLDFSECSTPVKLPDKVKSVGAASLSSPCLLKSFR